MNKLDNMKEQMSNVSEKMRTKELKGNRRNQKDCNRNEEGHSSDEKSERYKLLKSEVKWKRGHWYWCYGRKG